MIVSCSVRWNSIAFSIAIAHGSTSISTSARSARVKRPPSLLMISRTPIVRPRDTSGAHRIERVLNCVRESTRLVKRGSRAASLTIAGSPDCATQPATPSPILSRKAVTSRPLAPRAASNTSSCFSSSTISRDQASDGISWRIFSTTSSITLRGSRIELAVFTTSVRMASRLDEVWPTAAAARPLRPAPGWAPSRCASTAAGHGSEGCQASSRKSSASRSMRRRARASGESASPPSGRPGSARRSRRTRLGEVRRPTSTSPAS